MLELRNKIRLAALSLVAATMVSGCGKGQSEGQQAATNRPPVEVKVVTVRPENLSITTQLTGRTSAYAVAEVRPQVNGILQKRLFREGQDVKAGEQLYQIDPAIYEAQLQSAKATLAQARATLAQARADARRSSELVKVNAVSKQADDAAQAALKTAVAAVKAGEAAVKTAQINLDYTKVQSPITGRVSRSEFTEGALLSAYQTQYLTVVQQLDPIYVDVTQTADDLLRFKREIAQGTLKTNADGSAPVSLLLSDGTNYPLQGKLTFTDAQVEEGTGTVKLRAVFPNPNQDLLPGMFVRAHLVEGVRPDGIKVHMQSVMRDVRGDSYVYIVTPENKVEQRSVTVARTDGVYWVVDAGLKAGDRVMFEGFQRVQPGATVTAKEVDFSSLPEGKPLF